MKKTIIFLLMIFVCNIAKSQGIIDLCAQEIIKCTDERAQTVENATNEQLDIFINICIRDVYNGKLQSILDHYNQNKENIETFDTFSVAVLERMLNKPKTKLTVSDTEISEPIINDTITTDENESTIYLEPIKITIIDIKQKKFPTFIGRDTDGKIQEFIYLKPFPTDIMYRYNRILPDDKFIVSYNVIDIFDEELNEFITYRYVYKLIKQ